jgi:hypothetical protein
MKDCGKCIQHSYSGGQQSLAEGRNVGVETLCYVFCKHESVREHVAKTAGFECEHYEEKEIDSSLK